MRIGSSDLCKFGIMEICIYESMQGFDMIRRLISNRSGVSTLEFGLLVPILITFIVGGADYGLAMFTQLEMRSAARAGAQHAILSRSHDSTNIQSIVENGKSVV